MDFFKSILSEEPDDPSPDEAQPDSPSDSDHDAPSHNTDADPNHDSSASDAAWSFGGFMKTFATRSESVIETYRRDLEEFRSGLQKETELFKEAASRAVKDLPTSIEVGASVAQEMIKSTADIISQGKESLLAQSDSDVDVSDSNSMSSKSLDSIRYSRFDAQLKLIQSDVNTYTDEPEDCDDYSKWKLGFVLEEKSEEIMNLINESTDVERMYVKFVPGTVDKDTFWCRYFYKVHKLKLKEHVRASLVKRAIAIDDDEEELSWDVDDDDDDEEEENKKKTNVPLLENETKGLSSEDLSKATEEESSRFVDGSGNEKKTDSSVGEGNVVEQNVEVLKSEETTSTEAKNEKLVTQSDENVASKGKADEGESSKESNISVVPARTSSKEEEDLEWDEIDDLGSNDEKKVSPVESPSKADRQKRLSVAEEDEDLSWDIEDDDEPVKANAK